MSDTPSETTPDAPAPDEQAESDDGEALDAHLADLDDGCGCVEVWKHTSESRDE
ncbi:hypothetical protein [Halosegnis marinus]|uniref:Uncharacterized protein n=1 Tax=Halosegnis marinus TaxID=3034023 RepID=A0ABD5ZKC7_9EURY|nr:hypothetical protein [Halosegnis sp. DT85]